MRPSSSTPRSPLRSGYSVYWNTWGVRDAWRVRLLPHGDETQTFARHLVDDDEPDAADVTEEGVRLSAQSPRALRRRAGRHPLDARRQAGAAGGISD